MFQIGHRGVLWLMAPLDGELAIWGAAAQCWLVRHMHALRKAQTGDAGAHDALSLSAAVAGAFFETLQAGSSVIIYHPAVRHHQPRDHHGMVAGGDAAQESEE